ncbi:hypothetical protein OG481_28300 [Streptomyces longwoodensis]|uniref:hypothetical protein n=1 Tax=Streptomyces longwoodensis TaxID=68231 RepID=UPI003086BEF1|nr:hypothetical protein OG481_28300 [Streptomyces longwoodensis]WTI43556.1 hypothetical protein OG547_03055 [Streptomyces longwoodensis]WUC69849.1 hypothetical protein OG416_03030 [Streptomyces longwoodensis]
MRPEPERRDDDGGTRAVPSHATSGRAAVIRAGLSRAGLGRAVRWVGRTVWGEWRGIIVDPVRELFRRGPGALSLAFVACAGVIFFHAIAQHPTGATVVRLVGGVRGDLPLWLALLRTPVSLYVPALDLPVWAGITQLFLAFALAEVALGRRRTLLVAYVTTLAGTLTARVMIAVGPGWWGFGLPPEAGQVLDTGPSAAVVGLFTYMSVVRRAPVVFTLTGGSMVWESIAKPNLAGREHLIAVAAAVVMGLLHGRGESVRRRLRALWPWRGRTGTSRAVPATGPIGASSAGAAPAPAVAPGTPSTVAPATTSTGAPAMRSTGAPAMTPGVARAAVVRARTPEPCVGPSAGSGPTRVTS